MMQKPQSTPENGHPEERHTKAPFITSVIAHIDHGKTTLIDSIVAAEGRISKSIAGDLRYLDTRADEQEREITLKLSFIKLNSGHIFIDTPGHVDFEALLHSSTMLCDRHIIIIDCMEGITPRTYSLIQYIDREQTVLVINKIDKCDSHEDIEMIIHQFNSLIGSCIFSWDRNNVIICSAFHCAGVCKDTNTFTKHNTLKGAFLAFKMLRTKYSEDSIGDLLAKYKIHHKTLKNVYTAVMPLFEAIMSTLNALPDLKGAIGNELKKLSIGGSRTDPVVTEDLKDDVVPVKNGDVLNVDSLLISPYGIQIEKNDYSRDNVGFVCKILKGEIRKGDRVYCNFLEGPDHAFIRQQTEVESIYAFDFDRPEERPTSGDELLVAIKGDFRRNCVVSTAETDCVLPVCKTPFYTSLVILRDISLLPEIKRDIKTLSYLEPGMKCKLTRYSELEMRCGGRVQFEKICYDLERMKYSFEVRNARMMFVEYPRKQDECEYFDSGARVKMRITPIEEYWQQINEKALVNTEKGAEGENEDPRGPHTVQDENRNCTFVIHCPENCHVVESVLSVFVSVGPLIRESITNIAIEIFVILEEDRVIADDQEITEESVGEGGAGNLGYALLKRQLNDLYANCEPSITPLLSELTLFFDKKYIRTIYVIIQQYAFISSEEEYDEATEYCVVRCRMPLFLLTTFTEDVHKETKGTAYIKVRDVRLYDLKNDFSEYIPKIRQEKGLHVGEKIIEDPTRQRTLRR